MYNGLRVVGLAIARVMGRRLPGKALLPLAGKPALWHVVDRARHSAYMDEVAVCTTTEPEDDLIAELCEHEGWRCHRGPEGSVLANLAKAAEITKADIPLFSIQGDSPLLHYEYTDLLVKKLVETDSDIVEPYRSPDRLNIYWETSGPVPVSRHFLYESLRGAAQEQWKLHVNLTLRHTPRDFNFVFVDLPERTYALGRPYRLKLDTPHDAVVLSEIYSELYRGEPITMERVMEFLDRHPMLAGLNMPYGTGRTGEPPEVTERWELLRLEAERPEGSIPVWCDAGKCYLGWAERVWHEGRKTHRLHLPSPFGEDAELVVKGSLKMGCPCGAGREWHE